MDTNEVEFVLSQDGKEFVISAVLQGSLPVKNEIIFINSQGYSVVNIEWKITPEGRLGTIRYHLYPITDKISEGGNDG